jgi:hypothetical protein
VAYVFVRSDELSGFKMGGGGEFFDKLSDCFFLKEGSGPWSYKYKYLRYRCIFITSNLIPVQTRTAQSQRMYFI